VGVVVFPQLLVRIGVTGSLLVLVGGLAYTAGALIYARRRPDPAPTVRLPRGLSRARRRRRRLPVRSGRVLRVAAPLAAPLLGAQREAPGRRGSDGRSAPGSSRTACLRPCARIGRATRPWWKTSRPRGSRSGAAPRTARRAS
jgi:predicted membrane channel-forming protein YqfA (hemolysin III family)